MTRVRNGQEGRCLEDFTFKEKEISLLLEPNNHQTTFQKTEPFIPFQQKAQRTKNLPSSSIIMAPTSSSNFYTLELAVKPPTCVRPGMTMSLPIVVAVKVSAMKENGSGPTGGGDMSGVWAFVSLVNDDDSAVLAPPRTDLLLGRMAASVRAPSPRAEPNRRIVGYAHFPDLRISQPGQYRLRVSLIDMDSSGPSYREDAQVGLNVRSITSNIIRVGSSGASQPSKSFSPSDLTLCAYLKLTRFSGRGNTTGPTFEKSWCAGLSSSVYPQGISDS